MRVGRAEDAARLVEKRNAYTILVGNHEVRTPFGTCRGRWDNTDKTGLKEAE
jgi:hypothetical protein